LVLSDEGHRLRWSRYSNGNGLSNRRSLARFTLDGQVVISGAAPDPDVNRLICERFNGAEPKTDKRKGHWTEFSCLECGAGVTRVREAWTRADGITVIRTRICKNGHLFTTEERPTGRNNGATK
jgi:hypothetical protein